MIRSTMLELRDHFYQAIKCSLITNQIKANIENSLKQIKLFVFQLCRPLNVRLCTCKVKRAITPPNKISNLLR